MRDGEHRSTTTDVRRSEVGYSRSARRPLRILPFDPMLDRAGRSVIADVPYERLQPGPSGRLVQVIDYDGHRDCFYEPVDLDDEAVLINQGLEPSESDPRFHQQMVYAVVMRVLEAFERGLGRPFRWRGGHRLRVYPHAFQGRNAYFDHELSALLFGYFTAELDDPGPNLPGQTVFTCLSHDIVAHEATHAVLHRLRPHYGNPTNPDVLAFHEGFADIVAILQHFTYRDVVAEHIRKTRGDLTERTAMLDLAGQFGFATGTGDALRTALSEPDKTLYSTLEEEHDRGALLVAAVVDGFLRSYQDAIADLLRLATAGTGVLQPGAIHPDLVNRLADTAARLASQVLNACITAFDYLPPVNVTFGDYLRALVTADYARFPKDDHRLRANLIEGFRARGIYATGVVSLAERSLRIEPVDEGEFRQRLPVASERLLDATREFDRRRRARRTVVTEGRRERAVATDFADEHAVEWASPQDQEDWARQLHGWATANRGRLGLDRSAKIAVDGFYASQQIDGDGYVRSHVTVQFVQRRADLADEFGGVVPLGGVTVVADAEGVVRYVVRKPLPTEGSPELEALGDHVAAVEHRIRSVAWAPTPERRIVERLNLRSLDAH